MQFIYKTYILHSIDSAEAATRGVLWEKMLLEILQNWQENTCVRVSFLIKLQVWGFRAARWVNLIRKLWHSFQISKRCLIKSRNSHLQGLLNIGAPKININYVNNKKSEHFLTILRSNSNGCIREFFFFHS